MDLLKACDFAIRYHLSAAPEQQFPHYARTAFEGQQIIDNINRFGIDIAERDAILARLKPALPAHFTIKPQLKETNNQSAIKSDRFQRVLNSPQYQQSSAPISVPIPRVENLEKLLQEVTQLLNNIHTLDELRQAVRDFKTGLPNQDLSRNHLLFQSEANVDILWLNDIISEEDDRNNQIMSDKSGHMIAQFFNHLGYDNHISNQSVRRDKIIGYANFLPWPMGKNLHKQDPIEYQLFLPFMHKLIELIAPKKILISEPIALKMLLNVDGMMQNHGKHFTLNLNAKNYDCYGIYSATYIMRSDIAKKIFWFDLLKILNHNS